MFGIEKLAALTGIIAFIIFAAATFSGIRRFELTRYHRGAGYLCALFCAVHILLAVSLNIIEPIGVLASLFMLLTVLTGIRYKRRSKRHLVLTTLTFIFASAHVMLIMILS